MTAITLSTVGYGDILGVEKDPIAEIYTIFLIFTGMGTVLYAVSSITAFIVEGELKNIISEHSKYRRIRKMEDHYIICGAGETGMQVLKELYIMQKNIIVIEKNTKIIDHINSEYPRVITLEGDALEEETLIKANIDKAKALVSALSIDKDNLFIVITARFLNSNLKIISRAVDMSIESKLIRAGANYVVSPNYIGGMRIASILLRPYAVSFLDRMLRDRSGEFRVDEVIVEEGSNIAGKTLRDSQIRKLTGVHIFAYYPDPFKGECIFNPEPDTVIKPQSVLIFIGNREQYQKILKLSKKEFYKNYN